MSNLNIIISSFDKISTVIKGSICEVSPARYGDFSEWNIMKD